MEKLWTLGNLVQIQASVWSMQANLEAKDIEIEQGDIPDFVRLGYKRLFSKETKNAFNRIVSGARSTTLRYGFDFFLTGAYFVPNSTILTVMSALKESKAGFDNEVASFIKRYEKERDAFINRYPEHRATLAPFYPPKDLVQSKFGFKTYCYKISSTQFTADEVTSDEILYMDWATNTLNQLRQEARTVADSLKVAIADDSLDGRSVRKIATLVGRLVNLDFIQDVDLLNAAKAVALGPTTENLSQLKKMATDIPAIRVRKLLFD